MSDQGTEADAKKETRALKAPLGKRGRKGGKERAFATRMRKSQKTGREKKLQEGKRCRVLVTTGSIFNAKPMPVQGIR
jgi:hypothetical protein